MAESKRSGMGYKLDAQSPHVRSGPLYDVACHRIDAMNFLFGEPLRATGLLVTLFIKSA